MYKNVDDYIPKLLEMFPTIDKKDIKRMVEYGWRMFYFYNLRGCDTLIESQKHKFWMYCGEMCYDSLKYFNYYKRMLRRKLRVLYAKKHINWDGYYYTGLNEEEYKDLILSKNKKGRKKKYFNYTKKIAFKIEDEAKLFYSASKCIIKFSYLIDMGYAFYKNNLKCENIDIVLERECPDTFKDILITNDKYKLL